MIRRLVGRLKRYALYYFRVLTKPNQLSQNGIKINIDHEGIPDDLRRFFYFGAYEGDEVRILSNVLDPNERVLEIGAGIGFLSAYCARIIGNESVTAFEANPALLPKIKETYDLNGVNPELQNTLLSDSKGDPVSFFVEPSFWSSSTHRRSDNAREVKVETADINEVIQGNSPSMLIVDIEGGEQELIDKIDFAGNSVSKIIIELHPHVIGDRAASAVMASLLNNGFSIDFKLSKFPVLYLARF